MQKSLLEETCELVKSLTKSEKRYFKLYTKFQQGDKSYLKLFDILDKLTGCNEKLISQKFLLKHRATNFAAVIKYLFDQIIGSLKSYGAYRDLDSDHTNMIETYKVLHYKGLHGQSEKLLKRIKQVTWDDDAFTRHFSVLLMEYHKEFFNPDDARPAQVIRILKERRETLDIIDNFLKVGETFTLLRLQLRKKLYCRNKKDKDELTEIIAPLLKTTEADMLSRTALGMRNVTLCDYYLATGQPKKAFETSKIYLELRKNAGSNDKLDLQTLNEYFQHIAISVRSGFFEGFEENAKQYKILLDTVRNKEKYFIAYEKWHNCMLMYYNRTGQFEQGAAFIETEDKKGQVENNFSMKSKITRWYFYAYNLYARQQYKKSLQYIQRIMNQADTDIDEYSYAKLLLMFIHYDLKNFELLEYQVRSAQRMLEKKQRLYQAEKLMLDFFKNVNGVDSKLVQQQKVAALQLAIERLFKQSFEKGFIFYFDIVSWLQSQLEKKTFAAVVSKNTALPALNKSVLR
ncbi:MAG: hypothetical protein ABJA37_08735 [Ferruginibacter sp.]